MTDPLFILCPGRSFSSVVCSELGEHPQMYGLPELNLFIADTVHELLDIATRFRGRKSVLHGLIRVIAQLHDGKQTQKTAEAGWEWVREHGHWSTNEMYYYIQKKVFPKICVDKSPPYGTRTVNLARLYRAFPNASFLHLTRHPRATCNSLVRVYSEKSTLGRKNKKYDPLEAEVHWRQAHQNIINFTRQLPLGQSMAIQGEKLMAEPDKYLAQIAEWLGLRTDAEAIEAMKHPENSPYACFGPANARYGNNYGFLEKPALRTGKPAVQNLEDPLEWVKDGRGFSRETIQLARELGYQ